MLIHMQKKAHSAESHICDDYQLSLFLNHFTDCDCDHRCMICCSVVFTHKCLKCKNYKFSNNFIWKAHICIFCHQSELHWCLIYNESFSLIDFSVNSCSCIVCCISIQICSLCQMKKSDSVFAIDMIKTLRTCKACVKEFQNITKILYFHTDEISDSFSVFLCWCLLTVASS